MISEKTPRLLGAAFLFVFFASLISGILLMSVVGSGSVSDMLAAISNNLALLRLSILGQMVTAVGIIALAVLLYLVLNNQNKLLALVALGCWLAEAIVLAVSQIGVAALIPISAEFVNAGAPGNSFYQTLGQFLYYGLDRLLGSTIHMFFYCCGGLLWYYLFYKSHYIPRVISLFGLAAVAVALVGIVLEFLGYVVPIFVYLPIAPFELIIGAWLVLKGIRDDSETQGYRTTKPDKVTAHAN